MAAMNDSVVHAPPEFEVFDEVTANSRVTKANITCSMCPRYDSFKQSTAFYRDNKYWEVGSYSRHVESRHGIITFRKKKQRSKPRIKKSKKSGVQTAAADPTPSTSSGNGSGQMVSFSETLQESDIQFGTVDNSVVIELIDDCTSAVSITEQMSIDQSVPTAVEITQPTAALEGTMSIDSNSDAIQD